MINYLIKKTSDLLKYYGVINYISNNYDFFIYQVSDNVYLSNLPKTQHYQKINPYQFDVILSIMKPDEQGTEQLNWIKNTNIIHHFIETTDYTPPSKENYEKFYNLIQQYPNRKILIHCYAGKGRSNCMTAYYLMKTKNIPPNDAIKEIERINPRSNMNIYQKKSLFKVQ
jgi:predicted protein tyrosine phosphatase